LNRDERGITTVEYVVILVLIAIGSIGVWKAFGGSISGKAGEAGTRILNLESTDPGGNPSPGRTQANTNSGSNSNANVSQSPSPAAPSPTPKGAGKISTD
jgi:Flp pilus assembly pilin Flp